VDAWRPIGVQLEEERTADGPVPVVTIFIAGSECPFACVFCDLWRYTLDDATPEGALPAQIEKALEEVGPMPSGCRVKLYNASNFFDRRAVPPTDLPRIAALLGEFERIIVECHPRLVGEELYSFDEMVSGRLEVAMGLETIHPSASRQLNKKMTRADYDRASAALQSHGIPHRTFVLLGAPFIPAGALVDWAVVSAAYAIEHGAETVTLIPVRGGNGELERLATEGVFRSPSLSEIESAIERSLSLTGDAVMQIDLWDLEKFSACGDCFAQRAQRLVTANLTGVVGTAIGCPACTE
jgi:radical SAM enzyme (TIGR01210 family)